MPELDLNKRREERKNDKLGVIIGDKTYYIPLGKSLLVDDVFKLDKQEEVLKFFRKYLGEDVMKSLSVDDLETIINAWTEATTEQKGDGKTLGES